MKKTINLLLLSLICLWIGTLPAPEISPEARRFVAQLGMDPWRPSATDWKERGWLLKELGYKR